MLLCGALDTKRKSGQAWEAPQGRLASISLAHSKHEHSRDGDKTGRPGTNPGLHLSGGVISVKPPNYPDLL